MVQLHHVRLDPVLPSQVVESPSRLHRWADLAGPSGQLQGGDSP